jgi:hypothetical protein
MEALELLVVPLVELESSIAGITPNDLDQLSRDLDAIAIRAARVARYVELRGGYGRGDQGHSAAVDAQNKTAAKVRKALGFSYPKQDIRF